MMRYLNGTYCLNNWNVICKVELKNMEEEYIMKHNLSITYDNDWQKFNIYCRNNSFTYPLLCEPRKKNILLVFLNLQLDILLTPTTQTAMRKQEKDKHKSLSLQC